MIALAIIGLFGLTALSIDGGNAFSDHRHAQNAADNAAMSSALAKVRGNDWVSIGESIASTNGYNNDGLTNKVDIYSPPISGPYAGDDEYLQVIITSHIKTYFGAVVGIKQLTNVVEAVARVKPPTEMFLGNAMVSTCTDGKATFETNGGPATLVTGGGIFVNSKSDDCAFKVNGGSGTFTVPSISVVGEACYPEGTIGGVVPQAAEQLPVPDYTWLDDLVSCNSAPVDAYIILGTTLTPTANVIRISSAFPPKGIENLGAGVYCLEDTFRINNTGAILNGTNVTFVMLNKGLTLNGGEIRLSAPETGTTAGLLFYQPSNNTTDVAISGNAVLELTGTIIAPTAEVAVSGTPGTLIDGQVIGCEITLSGDSGGRVNYDDEKNIDDPPLIGLTN